MNFSIIAFLDYAGGSPLRPVGLMCDFISAENIVGGLFRFSVFSFAQLPESVGNVDELLPLAL